MRSAADIKLLADARRSSEGPMLRRMREVADHYNDDIVMPLSELDAQEKYAIPNLVSQGIDAYAMRAASVMPDMNWPALNPASQRSVDRAQKRRLAAFGWWEHSAMQLSLRQRARWLTGYGSGPVHIVPDLGAKARKAGTYGVPTWQPRNPMTALPSPRIRPYDVEVDDVVFTFTRPHRWLQQNYGIKFPIGTVSRQWLPDESLIEVIEYVDADEWVLLAVGPATDTSWYDAYSGVGKQIISMSGNASSGSACTLVELARVANRLGVCPVSMPGRIGLERIAGQMDSILGMRVLQARLMALEVNAVERAIFPNEWAVFSENGGQVVKLADGRKGIVGEVRGGQVQVTNVNPGVQTYPTMDRLERAQRLTGNLPSDFGGESSTNVRTGKRGDALLSAVIDHPLQESHQILARALTWENELAVATIKAYAGNATFSVYVSWTGAKNAKGDLTYVPNELFETANNTVSYSQAGSDSNNLVIGIGQRIGTELMSKATGRSLDPLIDDPEEEGRKVTLEGLERAVLASLEQAAASGSIPLDDLAFIAEQVKTSHHDVIAAVQAAQKRAQTRQASSGAPGTPAGPVEPGTPEAQPGLAAGTPAAAAATPPTVPQLPEGQANQVQMLRALATVRSQAGAA